MDKKNKVTVLGSSNTDLIIKSQRIPKIGETILGGDFLKVPGGKGANQAVAARLLGAEVCFITKVGEDDFGNQSISNYKKIGINTDHCQKTEKAPSGVAIIFIDNKGNNCIGVAPGANSFLTTEDSIKAENEIISSKVFLAQLEVPLETVKAAGALAKKNGAFFILDPAPAVKLDVEFLSLIDAITPNETETEILTGVKVTDQETAHKAADILLELGVKNVFLTLGKDGIFFKNRNMWEFIPPKNVNAVDSTAAGDAFAGALAFGVANGESPLEAAKFANFVAALSVTKIGAQSSLPTMDEVKKFIEVFKN